MKLSRIFVAALTTVLLSAAPSAMAEHKLVIHGPLTTVSELEDGKIYYIYDASKIQVNNGQLGSTSDSDRRALRYADTAGAQINGNKTIDPTSTTEVQVANPDQYRWQANLVEGQWQFKNIAFEQFISGYKLSDTAGNHTLTYDATRNAFLVSNGSRYWDGLQTGKMDTWTATGNGAHWYQFFAEEDGVIGPRDFQTYTINFKEGETLRQALEVDGYVGQSYNVHSNLYPLYNGVASGTFTDETTLTVQGTTTLPFRFTATEDWSNNGANMIWQAIESHGNENKYMWHHNEGGVLSDPVVERPNKDGYADEELWAFIGSFDDGFKIVNYAAGEGKYLTFNANNVAHVAQTEENVWKVFPSTAYSGDVNNQKTFACFKLVKADSSMTQFLNHNASQHKFTTWSAADEGSSNRFFAPADPIVAYYEANSSQYEGDNVAEAAYNAAKADLYNVANAKALTAALNGVEDIETFNAIKAKGDAFATFAAPEQTVLNAWNTIANTTAKKTLAVIDALKTEFSNMVASASTTIDGKHARFLNNKSGSNYMVPTNNKDQLCSNPNIHADKQIFTLKHANDNGFYLFNEYTNRYAQSPGNASAQTKLVTDKTQATVYVFKIGSFDGNANYAIAAYGRSGQTEGLHTDGSNRVVNWSVTSQNTWWSIETAEESAAAGEHLNGAKEYYNGLTFGTGLGEFNLPDDQKAQATEALNVTTDASIEEQRNAADLLFSMIPAINQPKAGHFYRFHYGSSYLSSKVNANNRFKVYTEENTNALNDSTVFYYDGTHLVTFPEGLVMGNLRNSYKGELSTSEHAGAVTFEASTANTGDYNIKLDTRYLYHDAANIDAGDGTNNNAGYRWNITEVTYLPIPHDGQEFLTAFSPVDLELTDGRVTPYHGTIQGTTLGKYAVEQNKVPANTPVLLKYNSGISDGCIYLQILYPAESAVALADETDDEPATDNKVSDLKGSIYATAKQEGMNYFTAQSDSFGTHTGDYIPGFSAHLAVDAETANADGYTIGDYVTTSISEIEKTANATATEVYDLQGRRVSKAGRGIFIVNGKKVLVK